MVFSLHVSRAASMRFRPLTGMVLRKVGTYDGDVGFRPLTGMVLSLTAIRQNDIVFVPLRGWY